MADHSDLCLGDRYGSFVIEKLYIYSDLAHKTRIATELARVEPRLNSSNSGKVIWRKFRLAQFKHKQQVTQRYYDITETSHDIA